MIRKVLLAVITLLWCEIILLGNGKWSVAYLGFNLRKILFTIMAVTLVLYLANNRIRREYYLLCAIAVGAWAVWGTMVPILTSTPLSAALQESAVVLGYALMPFIVSFFLENRKLWVISRKWIILSLLVSSAMHLVLLLSIAGVLPYSDDTIAWFTRTLNPEHDNNLNIALSGGVFVVVASWISSPFILLLLGIAFMSEYSFFKKSLIMALAVVALLGTGLRGLMFALVYSCFFTAVIKMALSTRLKSFVNFNVLFIAGVSLAALVILAGANPEVLEPLGLERVGSDVTRYTQTKALFDEIEKYLIVGKGFGSSAAIEGRSEGQFSFEQYILALVMKTGLMGVIVFGIYSITWTKSFERRSFASLNMRERRRYLTLFFLLTSIFAASAANPYLFNFAGMFFILFVVVEHALLMDKTSRTDRRIGIGADQKGLKDSRGRLSN